MKKIKFTKLHGLGNSYIYVDAWENQIEESQLAPLAIQVANPCTGIGSDGLILISPSSCADLKMRIFNKDGSEGRNCGNGLRCVAKYAFEKGLVKKQEMLIETLSGTTHAIIEQYDNKIALVSVNMGPPILSRREIPMLGETANQVINEPFEIDSHRLALTAVSMGNPHAVFFTPELNNDLHLHLGKKIERDSRFPEGVNVEFVHLIDPLHLRCRVWERGSGATQACGTGACASVVAAILNGYSPRNKLIHVQLDGGALKICWKSEGDLIMIGPAETVAEGSLLTT